MKNLLFITSWIVVLFLMPSCKDAYDFSTDKLAGSVEQTTDLVVPLINADITLEELLPDNEETSLFLQIDNDGFITLVYEDNIAAISAPEMFNGDYVGVSLPVYSHEETPREVPMNMDN